MRVVFRDSSLVVVDKPAGLLAVPGRAPELADCVIARLMAMDPNVRVVHRLDQDTSGLMVVARSAPAQAALQRQFESRTVAKYYVAVIDGELRQDFGVVTLPLRLDVERRPHQIVDRVHGRAAETQWRVLAREPGRTRVALTPITGRTHQLRVHAAHPEGLGLPIVGDRLYGRAGERLLLHAARLVFAHPVTGETTTFESPAPF